MQCQEHGSALHQRLEDFFMQFHEGVPACCLPSKMLARSTGRNTAARCLAWRSVLPCARPRRAGRMLHACEENHRGLEARLKDA